MTLPQTDPATLVLGQIDRCASASPGLRRFLKLFETKGVTWALVGGAPRSWVLGEPHPRDLDFVVTVEANELASRIRSLRCWPETQRTRALRNSFGGYKLLIEDWEIDVWPARETAALKDGSVSAPTRLAGVAAAAVLSSDSLVVSREGKVFESGFFAAWEKREIWLRTTHVLHSRKLLDKAIRLCLLHALSPDLALQAQISSLYGQDLVHRLMRRDRRQLTFSFGPEQLLSPHRQPRRRATRAKSRPHTGLEHEATGAGS